MSSENKCLVVNLPDEILAIIFKIVVASSLRQPEIFQYRHGEMNASIYRKARHQITATCQRWRHVAFVESSLFSTVMISLLDRMEQGDESRRFQETLEMDLRRTNQRMISLSIYGGGGDYLYNAWTNVIYPTLSPRSEKCREIGIKWDLKVGTRSDFAEQCGKLAATPYVQRLCLRIHSMLLPIMNEHPVLDLSRTITLESLCVWYDDSFIASPRMGITSPLSWGIKDLTLSGNWEPLNVVAVLNSCTRLERLVIGPGIFDSHEDTTDAVLSASINPMLSLPSQSH